MPELKAEEDFLTTLITHSNIKLTMELAVDDKIFFPWNGNH